MVEDKIPKTKVQSEQLSDSDTPDEEANPQLRTSEEERIYGTIRGSTQAMQAALSHSRAQTNLTVERGPPWRPKIKKLSYEPHQSIATSTPRATSTDSPEKSTEAYRQILPGMSSQLYLTLVANSSLDTHIPDNQDTLHTQLTSEVDKYLQEAAERCEMDINYFDG